MYLKRSGGMYLKSVFVIGNIASGKSTAARYLESKGAVRIDLDTMAKDLYQPGSEIVQELCEAFGWDILDENGGVNTRALAFRAFDTPEAVKTLNNIVHPVLLKQLSQRLLPVQCCSTTLPITPLTVVEVSAPASFTDAFPLADEIIAITAPFDIRRNRAIERGMDADDFDRRAEAQPSEEELLAMATVAIDNSAADDRLFHELDAWLASSGVSFDSNGRIDA